MRYHRRRALDAFSASCAGTRRAVRANVSVVARILIVDDDRSIRRTLEKFLGGEGYQVATAQDAPGAIAAADAADLMLLDLGLPGGSGFDVLTALAERPRPPTVVVITARDDMQSTVKAIQLGAYESLVKPIDIDRLRGVIRQALDSRETRDQLEAFVTRSAEARMGGDILGKSPAIRDVWKQIGAVSTTRAPVLIIGESGTGKELVARAIHVSSADRDRPFVAVNCTALAPGVLESELFGHVKGAFTGADKDRQGRFEYADGGTLFLDEVGDMPLLMQAKLLRTLQEREFERVGGAETIKVDVRLVSATNRNLEKMIEDGEFREDLYYRLSVFPLEIPPLRERPGDVIALARRFVAARGGTHSLSDAAIARLVSYAWPGNVRELENAMQRALLLCDAAGVIEPRHLVLDERARVAPSGATFPGAATLLGGGAVSAAAHAESGFGPPAGGLADELWEEETRRIVTALASSRGREQAAELLGISGRTLRYKLQKMRKAGIHVPGDRA